MRKIAVFISVIALAALMVVYAVPASADVVADSGFQGNDGNLDPNLPLAAPGIDWNSFAPATWAVGSGPTASPYRQGTASASSWSFNGFEDAAVSTSDTSFAGGVKQDKDCAVIGGSKAPNKDDLKRIYIANKTVTVAGSPHVMLGLAWVRIPQNTTSPSAHVGFEFNEGLAGTCPTLAKGSSDGLLPRTPAGWGGTPAVSGGNPSNPGDLLFVYDFTGGSTAPTLTLRHWIDSNSSIASDPTNACDVGSDSVPCWSTAVDLTTSGIAQAQVNATGSVTDLLTPPLAPNTASVSSSLGTKEFGEAIVDLTAAGVFAPGVCTGFGQAEGVSRSSGNSGTAAMEDLDGPGHVNIANCGRLVVNKTDGTNLLDGAGFTVTPGVPPATSSTMTGEGTGVFCLDGLPLNRQVSVSETTVPPGYSASADQPFTPTTAGTCSGVDSSTTPDLTFTDTPLPQDINISKVDDAGNPVDGAVFTIYSPAGTTAGVPSGTAAGTCTTGIPTAGSGACTISNVAPGTYTIDEVPPAGYAKDSAFPQTITVSIGSPTTVSATDNRLFKMIVLVCQQSNNHLYPSSVSIDSATASNSESSSLLATLVSNWATAQSVTLTSAQKTALEVALCSNITTGAKGGLLASPLLPDPHGASVTIPH